MILVYISRIKIYLNHMVNKIFGFPYNGIAYVDSLYKEIEKKGVSVEPGYFYGKWIIKNVTKNDVVHFHWPSFYYAVNDNKFKFVFNFFRFIFLLILLYFKSNSIWWTAHNLMPHKKSCLSCFDYIGRIIVILVSKKIFVHSLSANEILINKFKLARYKTYIIPHGHWVDHYPRCSHGFDPRNVLNLPNDKFIFLLFGQCLPYKNLIFLVETFLEWAGPDDFLLIAGNFPDKNYYSKTLSIINNDLRIRIDNRYIPDELVSCYFESSNAFCIPYKEILTSGSAMLALSFGIPVLSVKMGFLVDIVTDEVGVLVRPDDQNDLKRGFFSIKNKQWSNISIIDYAKRYSFEESANIMLS